MRFFRSKSKDPGPGRLRDEDDGGLRGRGPIGFGSDDLARMPSSFPSQAVQGWLSAPAPAPAPAPPTSVGGSEATVEPVVVDAEPVQERDGTASKTDRREKKEKKNKEHKSHRRRDANGSPPPAADFGAAAQWGPTSSWTTNGSMPSRAPPAEGFSFDEQFAGADNAGPPTKPHKRHKSRSRQAPSSTGDLTGRTYTSDASHQGMINQTGGYQAADGIYPGMQNPALPGRTQTSDASYQGMINQTGGYQAADTYPGMQNPALSGRTQTSDASYQGMINQTGGYQAAEGIYPGRQNPALQGQHQGIDAYQIHPGMDGYQGQDGISPFANAQGMVSQGQWSCPQCTFINPDSSAVCEACGCPWQPPAAASEPHSPASVATPWQSSSPQWQPTPNAYTPPPAPAPGAFTSGSGSPARPFVSEAAPESSQMQEMQWFYSQVGSRSLSRTPSQDQTVYAPTANAHENGDLPRTAPAPQQQDPYSWMAKPSRLPAQFDEGLGAGLRRHLPGGPPTVASMQHFRSADSASTYSRNSPVSTLPAKVAPKLDLDWAKPTNGRTPERGYRRTVDLSWAQTASQPSSTPMITPVASQSRFEDPLLWAGHSNMVASGVVKLGSVDGGEEQQKRAEELVGILQEEIRTLKQFRDSQQDVVLQQLHTASNTAIQQLETQVKFLEQEKAAVVEKMTNEMRERDQQKNALVEKLQVEMRQKEQQKEALVFQFQSEIRQKEQQKELQVQQLQGEVKLKEHEKEVAIEQLQGEIKRLRDQQQDALVHHLQDEIKHLKEQPLHSSPAQLPRTTAFDQAWGAAPGSGSRQAAWGASPPGRFPAFGSPENSSPISEDLPSFGHINSGNSFMSFGDPNERQEDSFGQQAGWQNPLSKVPEESVWMMSAEEVDQYRNLFVSIDVAAVGTVGAEEARSLFEESRLPADELSVIWRASDLDGDSRLSMKEFICAMAIVKRRQENVPLPTAVPPELLAQLSAIGESAAGASRTSAPAARKNSSPPPQQPAAAPQWWDWHATVEEVAKYSDVFTRTEVGGFAGPEAKAILERTNLPVEELSSIWQTSDIDRDGHLSLVEWIYAMAIVARRLQGAPLPDTVPPELIASVQAAGVGSGDSSTPHKPSNMASSQNDDFWAPTPEEKARFRVVFDSLGCPEVGGGFVGPDEGRELLERSKLPPQDLSSIWRLSDVDGDGRLAPAEFLCAMTLVARRRQGAELPEELPAELLKYVGDSQELPAPTPSFASAAMPMPAAAPPSTGNMKGGSPAPSPPNGSRAVHAESSSSSSASPWALTPDEVERYRGIFAQIDVSNAGAIGAKEGREVLEGSNLPLEDLSGIWELSDVSEPHGQLTEGEFVCAMALVARRRRDMPLPPDLPPELAELVGISSGGGSMGSASMSAQPAAVDPWRAHPDEIQRFIAIFRDYDATGSGLMAPDDARIVLDSSGLPVEDLQHIWRIADVDQDGKLAQHEFIWAMAITMRRRQGEPLPETLPQSLVESVPRT